MVDFQKKIEFLLENLYKNINELAKAFHSSDNPTAKDIRSRKVAIRKWLSGEQKSARFKEYENYPIAKLRFKSGMYVFPITAFTDWRFEKFRDRLKEYQEDKESRHISLKDYKYIYYYHEAKKELVYFEIEYDNEEVTLYTKHHAQMLVYKGDIKRHSNMLYYIVSSSDEMMFFSFSELNLKLDYDVYGLALTKDYILQNPKTSMVLLSQKLLTNEQKKMFETKINISNITIADNEKKGIEAGFRDNLSKHLYDLKSVVDNYNSQNIFLNLFLDEFNLFYNKFEQFSNQHGYYLSSFSKGMMRVIDLLLQTNKKHHIQVIYTLKDFDKSLFNPSFSDSIEFYNRIITLSKEEKISFEFIIVLREDTVIDRDLKDKFREFQEANIPVYFRRKKDIKAYSTIVLIQDYMLAIFGLKGEDRYKITNYPTDVFKLTKEYEVQKKYANTLKEIIEEDYPLNGRWYQYGYGSNDALHFAIFDIDGDSVDITLKSHDNRKFKGVIHKVYDDILLCTSLAIVKFRDDRRNPVLRIVSLMSDQHNGNGKPIILYGILSRVEIDKEDRDKLFSVLVDRKTSSYEKASFKLSLSIDEVLYPLLFKYEERYKKLKTRYLSDS